MPDQVITLEESLRIAREAKEYARTKIKKGSTQLENNQLPETYYHFLLRGVSDMRDAKTDDISNSYSLDPLEPNAIVIRYEHSIASSTKYSLGNCEELAFQALDYILDQVPITINAEVYLIRGGDHVMLVINRSKDSDPKNPTTWGDNAVICDPWSDMVFKASDYLTKVKNFCRHYGDTKIENHVHNFNPKRHQLVPISCFNSTYLSQHRTVNRLKTNFTRNINNIIDTTNNFKKSLKTEVERLRQRYGDHDSRIIIIESKMNLIDQAIQSIREEADHILEVTRTNNYRYVKTSLMESLNILTKKATLAMQFEQHDVNVLIEHQGTDKKTAAMKFFGLRSTTHAHIKHMTKQANEQLRKKYR